MHPFLMEYLIIFQQTCPHTHQFRNVIMKQNNQGEISRGRDLNMDDLLIGFFSKCYPIENIYKYESYAMKVIYKLCNIYKFLIGKPDVAKMIIKYE